VGTARIRQDVRTSQAPDETERQLATLLAAMVDNSVAAPDSATLNRILQAVPNSPTEAADGEASPSAQLPDALRGEIAAAVRRVVQSRPVVRRLLAGEHNVPVTDGMDAMLADVIRDLLDAAGVLSVLQDVQGEGSALGEAGATAQSAASARVDEKKMAPPEADELASLVAQRLMQEVAQAFGADAIAGVVSAAASLGIDVDVRNVDVQQLARAVMQDLREALATPAGAPAFAQRLSRDERVIRFAVLSGDTVVASTADLAPEVQRALVNYQRAQVEIVEQFDARAIMPHALAGASGRLLWVAPVVGGLTLFVELPSDVGLMEVMHGDPSIALMPVDL